MTTFLISVASDPNQEPSYKVEKIFHPKKGGSCPLYPLEIEGKRRYYCYIPTNLQPPLCHCNNLNCSNNEAPLSKEQKLIPPSIELAKKLDLRMAQPLLANRYRPEDRKEYKKALKQRFYKRIIKQSRSKK